MSSSGEVKPADKVLVDHVEPIEPDELGLGGLSSDDSLGEPLDGNSNSSATLSDLFAKAVVANSMISDVSDSLADEEERSRSHRIDKLILDGCVGYECSGKKIEEWMRQLDDFYGREVIPHDQAAENIKRIIQAAHPIFGDDHFDWHEEQDRYPDEVFYSSAQASFGTDRARAIQASLDEIISIWKKEDRDENSRYHFLHNLRRPFNPRKAAMAPMMMKCERMQKAMRSIQGLDATKEADRLDIIMNSQKYQLLYLTATSAATEELEDRKRRGETWQSGRMFETKHEKGKVSKHRIAHMFWNFGGLFAEKMRAAGKVGKNIIRSGVINEREDDPKAVFSIPAVTVAFFEKTGWDQEKVDEYIRSMLSLILPNKGTGEFLADEELGFRLAAQEDMILMNLIVLAKEDKSGELWKKYGEIFTSLYYYRRIQHIRGNHWEPHDMTRDPDPATVSVKDMVEAFWKRKKNAPTILFFGSGDGLMERFIDSRVDDQGRKMVGNITSVDVDYNIPFGESFSRVKDGIKEIVIGVKDKIIEKDQGDGKTHYEVDPDFLKDELSMIPGADIVVVSDVLHETHDPLPYGVNLYDKVSQGGYYYISEPTHCEAVDKLTHVAVHPYDLTKFRESMVPIEALYNVVHWLTSIEGAYNSPDWGESISPGNFSGNNDSLWRVRFSFQKPETESEKNARTEFKVPVEDIDWNLQVQTDEDIFKIWPLTLVPEDKRVVLIKALYQRQDERGEGDRKSLAQDRDGRNDLTFAMLKRRIVELLLSKGELAHSRDGVKWRAEGYVGDRVPYPKLRKMLKTAGKSRDFERGLALKNLVDAEGRAVQDLLESEGIEAVA